MLHNTKGQAVARAAHILAARREAEALDRRAAHAMRQGNEKEASKWARKARQFRARSQEWGG